MTTATMIRATALPMPEVVQGDLVTIGHKGTRVRSVTIGDEPFVLGGNGIVYVACWKCPNMTGYLPHYAGLYEGVCFACGGVGVKMYAKTLDAAQRKIRSAQAKAARHAAKWEAERPAREAAEKAAAETAMLAAWEAALREEERWQAKAAEQAAQRYVGEVGDKVTVTGVVAASVSIESRYGMSRLVIITGTGDDQGVTLKTFGTSEWHYATEKGEAVTVVAMVKAHEVYQETKQTVVIRPKAVGS